MRRLCATKLMSALDNSRQITVETQPAMEISSDTLPLNDERRLVEEVLSKDRKATAEFVGLCTDSVYSFVRKRLVPRVELVEDIVQEILLAAWQGLPKFRGDASLRSWILGIARHKIDDYYRRRLREADITEEGESLAEPAIEPLLDRNLDAAAEQDRVERTLTLLPEAYTLALIWRYRDEKSVREMAQLSGKTEKAMERLLARARENFRKEWNHAQS
jgi:RNA polymerase sigma-70 factor (ECF subfamily)